MAGRYVRVHQTNDPIEGELVRDLLEQQEIDARLIGTTNAAILGAGQHIFKLRIEVPDSQEAEALEVLEAYRSSAGEATNDDATGGDDETATSDSEAKGDEDAPAKKRRPPSRILAAGAACVVPGGCHFYLGRRYTAVVLLLAFLAGMILIFADEGVAVGALLMIGVVLSDIVTGQLSFSGARRDVTPSAGRQVFVGVLVAAAALGFAALALAWLSTLPPPRPDPLEQMLLQDGLEAGEPPLPLLDPTAPFGPDGGAGGGIIDDHPPLGDDADPVGDASRAD